MPVDLGACGVLLMPPNEIKAWSDEVRVQSNGIFQLNIWIPDPLPRRDPAHEASVRTFLEQWGPSVPPEAGDATPPDFEAQCEAMLAAGPPIISSVMGLYPADFVAELKRRNIAWFANVSTVAEARAAEGVGADVIVAQGAEAGGHRGAFDAAAAVVANGGLVLTTAGHRRSAVLEVPVVGTGGIADGRGVAAALVLGASAAQIGTGFLAIRNVEGVDVAQPLRRVLLDGQGPDATILDQDAFDVRSDATASDTSQHVAAARGAQSIATASGHKVSAVQVTWTSVVEADGAALLKSLADLGFENVRALPLSRAVQAWGIEVGRVNEHHMTALCVLEPGTATVMVVATGAGTVRTAVIDNCETTDDLVESLRTIFGRDGWLPESLHVIGARSDLDQVAEPIRDALPIPVIETLDTQLAFARGAALVAVGKVDTGAEHAAETPADRPWRVSPQKLWPAPRPPAVAPSVAEVDTESSQDVEAPRNDPRPRRERPWVVSHAKQLTISAAAVVVFGAALSLAAGSALNVENVSAVAANPSAGGASVTSASVHAVPAPVSAPSAAPVQPLAAQPPPAPPAPPAPLAPPNPRSAEPLAIPAESVATAAPQPVAVPVPRPTVAASPSATPLAAPAPPSHRHPPRPQRPPPHRRQLLRHLPRRSRPSRHHLLRRYHLLRIHHLLRLRRLCRKRLQNHRLRRTQCRSS